MAAAHGLKPAGFLALSMPGVRLLNTTFWFTLDRCFLFFSPPPIGSCMQERFAAVSQHRSDPTATCRHFPQGSGVFVLQERKVSFQRSKPSPGGSGTGCKHNCRPNLLQFLHFSNPNINWVPKYHLLISSRLFWELLEAVSSAPGSLPSAGFSTELQLL